MQEAYRPPRSKCSLCWWGGTPSSHGRGYPIQSWWGSTPSRPGWRVIWGTHHHPDLAGGYPRVPTTIQTWLGVPQGTPHHSDLPPPSRPDWGTPPTIQIWLGYPHPHHPDLAGVPPPPSKYGLTNKLKTVPSPILRIRAIKIVKMTAMYPLLSIETCNQNQAPRSWVFNFQQSQKRTSS